VNLADFLNVGSYLPERDFAKPVMELITATTRALNAYADNRGKPTLTYIVQNSTTPLDATTVEKKFAKTLMDFNGHVGSD
jgi:hypothetical protein